LMFDAGNSKIARFGLANPNPAGFDNPADLTGPAGQEELFTIE